jgi:thiamine pyrophosphokinase
LLNRIVIFANGELPDLEAARAVVQPTDTIIAADGGAKHCRALGLTPHVVIGDFDSLSPADLAALGAAGTRIIRHPARKEQTDLELALDLALAEGAKDILILGALGGRWDQTLANVLLLIRSDRWRVSRQQATKVATTNVRVRLLDGMQEISLLRGPGELALTGDAGDTVSLIPIGGDARGITTSGLEYPLRGENLIFGSTRGISNVMMAGQATISLTEGLLVCTVIRQNTTTNLGK